MPSPGVTASTTVILTTPKSGPRLKHEGSGWGRSFARRPANLGSEIDYALHLTDDTLNLVGNRIDLAFRTGILPDSTLIARKLGSTHRILCASPDYLARRGVPVASGDLARHHCVIAGPSTGSAHWVLDGPRGQETVAVSGRFAANEMQAVVAQLPYQVAEASVRDGRLRRVLDDAGWRALCRVSEQPTRFAFGQGIDRARSRAIGRHWDHRG